MVKDSDIIKKTKRAYGFLWRREQGEVLLDGWHFNDMQKVVRIPIVKGGIGIDIGSGCGYDTYMMARDNPQVKIVSLDISDGIFKAKELTRKLKNVLLIKGSVLDMPMKDSVYDFAYSYGVLHHTVDPKMGLQEIARILKKNAPVFLYLYENHSENIIKYAAVKIISKLRSITVRMHPKIIYTLSWLASPFIFVIFSFPSKILRKFKGLRNFALKIPFNFGTSLFSLRGDLYDRFSAPIEHRFSKKKVMDMFIECGFSGISITRLDNAAGWIAWGYKNNA